MKRRNLSAEETQQRIVKANEIRSEKAREKSDFDQLYRKSKFFKYSFIARIVMALFCCYFYFFDSIFFYPKEEIITSCKVEKEVMQSRRTKYVNIYVYIETDKGNDYNIDVSHSEGDSESFYKGDTINIVHSILHKPSYLSLVGGSVFYILTKHLVFKQFFLFVGIACVLSLFMMSGFEKASRYFVKFVTYLIPVIILAYLLL